MGKASRLKKQRKARIGIGSNAFQESKKKGFAIALDDDLALPEIKNHLDAGKQAIKLALSWNNRLSFVLDENLGVKRLPFLAGRIEHESN